MSCLKFTKPAKKPEYHAEKYPMKIKDYFDIATACAMMLVFLPLIMRRWLNEDDFFKDAHFDAPKNSYDLMNRNKLP